MNILDRQILYELFAKQYHSRLLNEASNARLRRQLRAGRKQNQSKEHPRTEYEYILKNAIVTGLTTLVKLFKSESKKEICS